MAKQSGPRVASGNRSARGWGLNNGVAAAAGELGAHVADDFKVSGHPFKGFAHILTQTGKVAAAARAGLLLGHDFLCFTRQVLRQRLAHGCPALMPCDGLGLQSAFTRALIDVQLFELEAKLVDLAFKFLRLLTKQHALEFVDQ